MYDPLGAKLSAQLRIAEIDGELEKLHVWMMSDIGVFERAQYLRMEMSLRLERDRLERSLLERS